MKTVEERFWGRVAQSDECWLWTGAANPQTGYAYIEIDRRKRLVHRVSYEWAHDCTLVPDQVVMHMCDVRLCVRPDHLRVGTTQDNHADCVAKGRHAWPTTHLYGEKNGNSRLSDEQRLEIAALDGVLPQREIAALFGVAQPTVNRLLKLARAGRLIVAHAGQVAA